MPTQPWQALLCLSVSLSLSHTHTHHHTHTHTHTPTQTHSQTHTHNHTHPTTIVSRQPLAVPSGGEGSMGISWQDKFPPLAYLHRSHSDLPNSWLYPVRSVGDQKRPNTTLCPVAFFCGLFPSR
ncbi:hypothetical protein BZA05DRAFT_201313 [Tricharina praecox]|uniref:uncharacterized protein n=1 Tax=Tricharina praecox TaxID=43433 RepID=UPI00222044D4|nr:uncharacterized protein BZA05DRAFT_201313 [Tricharina praecox]KAI5856454.1 hypothetical protein BZA05DRAFT_201313 [Tricharina praecox]